MDGIFNILGKAAPPERDSVTSLIEECEVFNRFFFLNLLCLEVFILHILIAGLDKTEKLKIDENVDIYKLAYDGIIEHYFSEEVLTIILPWVRLH